MTTADIIGVIGGGRSHIRVRGDLEEVQFFGKTHSAVGRKGAVRNENFQIHKFSHGGGSGGGAAIPPAA